MKGLGYPNARVLKGGVDAWRKAGYPILARGPVPALLGRILVPLDGSEVSEAVLYQAERLLCGRQGEVLLFHSWNPEFPDFGTWEEADGYLKRIQDQLRLHGASVVRHLVRIGPIAKTLPEAIEAEKPSLVAISTHGRDTSPRVQVAEVVEEILLESRVPLFVARSFRPSDSGEPIPSECEAPTLRRILLPLDGSSTSEAVMPYARELGLLLGARMVVLHVAEEESDATGSFWESKASREPPGPPPGEGATAEERIDFAARTFAAAGLETMTLHHGGDPITSILEFARPSAVDLIALTTHGKSGLSKLLIGSVALRVLREALLPTLLVRSSAP